MTVKVLKFESWLLGFYGISTVVGYLSPNQFLGHSLGEGFTHLLLAYFTALGDWSEKLFGEALFWNLVDIKEISKEPILVESTCRFIKMIHFSISDSIFQDRDTII